MKQRTLREVCAQLGVSRRAVQGYETAGLVSPTGRDLRGWLLYDDAALERIRTIRMYQRLGFPVKEIAALLKGPDRVRRRMLEERLRGLRAAREEQDRLIAEAETILQSLQKEAESEETT